LPQRRDERGPGLPQTFLEEREHRAFDAAQFRQAATQRGIGFRAQRPEGGAVEIAVENHGVNVAFAAYGRRIPELRGHALDRVHDVLLGLRFRVESFELVQREGGEHGSGPGAKIFRGKFRPGDLAQIGVHIFGFDVLHAAVFIH
jgi:hypothetical protein